MITIKNKSGNGVVTIKSFPDCSQLLKFRLPYDSTSFEVTWLYEGDTELFALYCFVNKIRDLSPSADISLVLPYVPNARMDRVNNPEDVFTLKYFAKIINSCNFSFVNVFDAHSIVTEALIDRCINASPEDYIERIWNQLGYSDKDSILVYPDLGCAKRLEGKLKHPYVVGNKKRDWSTGKLQGTDIIGKVPEKGFRVLFVDDICAYGGTAFYTLEALKQLGAGECNLYFSHIEMSIFGDKDWESTGKGEPKLLNCDWFNKIYTAKTIYNGSDSRIESFPILV